jgi:hypothetical protein
MFRSILGGTSLNTNRIPQSWTAVILGVTSGRQYNSDFVAHNEYWQGKMFEQDSLYRPFSELDDAIGIAPHDWSLTDDRGRPLSFMGMWLEHIGEAPPHPSVH